MTTANTLRRSRAMFSERYGVPADVNYYLWVERSTGIQAPNPRLVAWTPRGEPSNCSNLAIHMHKFAKLTPWQVHSVARNVFAGRIPVRQAGAVAHNMFGQPPFAIAISDGLYAGADQCAYIWETMVRVMLDLLTDFQRGLDEEDIKLRLIEAMSACRIDVTVKKAVDHLRHTLRDGDPGPVLRLGVEAFELPILGVPSRHLRYRPQRWFLFEQFVIAHELAHIILGHLGPTGSPASSSYAQATVRDYRTLPTWDMLASDSQRAEAEADLFGFFELCHATNWEASRRRGVDAGWRDRSQLALLAQELEGAAIANLVFYLLSALGVPECQSSTHPHPDRRFALITEAALTRMENIISTTSEPNDGVEPYPSGFYERVMYIATEWIPYAYRTITGALEMALHFPEYSPE